MPANPLKADPTRTTPIRRRFEAELGRRFSSLTTALHTLLVREDALGLVANQRWAFETNERKLRSFRSWLRYWSAQNILGTDAEQPERPWTANYVYPAYRRGAERAITDARKTKARESVLAALAEGAVSRERLQLLYLRSFEDLRGVTYGMSVQMSKILGAGLVAGDNPRTIARRLAEQVGLSRNRALMIARTEIVYAHAEGQLDAFQQLGIEQVDAQVEWLTAGDGRVCFVGDSCVQVDGQPRKLRDVKAGDRVLAHGRETEVLAAWSRFHNGPMVAIYTRTGSMICTEDHPILTDRGWVAAADITTSHILYSADDQIVQVLGTDNFRFQQSKGIVAKAKQAPIALRIACKSFFMPIIAIGLNHQPQIGQEKIE